MRYTEETLIPAVLTIMPAVPVGRLAERVGLRQSDNRRGDLAPGVGCAKAGSCRATARRRPPV